ncbi:MAG: aspartate aminotransferase family protein [Bryobacterales bacterium]|nr:aspartate aminotransferase family protein [Bryobacterales bacterium]
MTPVETPVPAAQPDAAAQPLSFSEQVIAREKQYVLQNYGRYPLVLARGRGAWVYDPDGNRYLDLLSGIGVNALGHAHPRLLRVLREQAGLMIHISNLYYHEYQGRLAERLARVSGLQRSFFCNSGTEAMEAAIKMARAHGQAVHPDKYELVALENSFHGRSIGALSVTGQPKYQKPFGPLLPGVRFVPMHDVAALEAAVNERTAGILMEPVQGEGGVYPVPPAMVRKARELADRHDALLIFDEIQCGVGRLGTWFAFQGIDPVVMPDVLASAKPVGCGIPIGFVLCNERAARTIPAGMHGTTFGGGPLATRVALEFMDVLEELLPQVRARGDYFRHKLETLKSRYSFIRDVRVHGLMIGVELDRPGKDLVAGCMKEGLLINCTHDVVLRLLPPYIISESEIDKAARILNRVFKRWGTA